MTGFRTSWVTRNYYLMFKGNIQGIASIPMSEGSGHCPTLRLKLGFLDKENKLQVLSLQQFKYLLRKFRKEIAAKGFEDFVLEFSGFFMQKNQELTQNLFTIYRELRKLFGNRLMFDCYSTEKEIHLRTEIFSTRRR